VTDRHTDGPAIAYRLKRAKTYMDAYPIVAKPIYTTTDPCRHMHTYTQKAFQKY